MEANKRGPTIRNNTLIFLAVAALAICPLELQADVTLGAAGNYAVLAGSTVTNTGSSVVSGGDVGVSPGTAITGFSPESITAPYAIDNAGAGQAQSDLTAAYNTAAGLAKTQDISGQNLGSMVLNPGVYYFSTSAQLTGSLTLNNTSDPNAQFIFQIGSTLTTASGSQSAPAASVVMTNGQDPNVFWQVGSSATLGDYTQFEGHILANTSITLDTGATMLDGSALARNGAVTLENNTITNMVPEPSTMALLLIGSLLLGLPVFRTRWHDRRHS